MIPESIKKLAQKVRTEIYGRDVRESIAKSMEVSGETSNEANERSKDTDARQTDVENRFDDQIAGNTDIDEVIDARRPEGGESYPTLRKRLDDEHKEVTTQLAQNATNVKSFGAKGDGATDDTDAIQNALDSGGKVFFPNGIYKFTKTLHVGSDTIVEGIGVESNLILGDNFTLDVIKRRDGGPDTDAYALIRTRENSKNIVFRDLKITGNKNQFIDQRQFGLCFVECENGLADNVSVDHINYFPTKAETSFTNALGFGLSVLRSKNITVRGGAYTFGGYENIGTEDCENVLIDGVYCGAGWRTSLQIHRNSKKVKVINSTIEQVGNSSPGEPHSAFTVHGVPSDKVYDLSIINNTIQASGNSLMGLQMFNSISNYIVDNNIITSDHRGLLIINSEKGGIVTNNKITAKQIYGAKIENGHGVRFNNNQIISEVGYCLEIYNTKDCSFTDNLFTEFGISIKRSPGLVVSRNNFKSIIGDCIYINEGRLNLVDTKIENNYADEVDRFLRIENTMDVFNVDIRGNKIKPKGLPVIEIDTAASARLVNVNDNSIYWFLKPEEYADSNWHENKFVIDLAFSSTGPLAILNNTISARGNNFNGIKLSAVYPTNLLIRGNQIDYLTGADAFSFPNPIENTIIVSENLSSRTVVI